MKQLWTILKYFGIAAGSIGVLYGVFTFFDGMQDDITSINTKVDYINVEQAFMAEDIAGLHDTLENMAEAISNNTNKPGSLIWMERVQKVSVHRLCRGWVVH